MKDHRFKIKIVFILFVLLISTLSGCITEKPTDEEENENTLTESDLEVVSYTVETQTMKFDKTFEKIADGFVYSKDAYRYLVRGKVKNNGTENISKAWVIVNFYDAEDNMIYSLADMIFHFKPNDIRDFAVDFTKYDGEDFPNADHIDFTFMQE